MPPLGKRKPIRSKDPDTRKFTRSRFHTSTIKDGASTGKVMVRFSPPGSKQFHTLAVVGTHKEGRELITRMKAL